LGGYTSGFVVHEKFGVLIPSNYPLEAAGPVMCAGVTLFDPLRRYCAGPGTRVAILGMGGLGSIGIKIAKALGAHVTAVTRSASKVAFAKRCGADEVLLPSDLSNFAGKFDLVLNTIPVEHDYMVYSPLLERKRGSMIMLGLNTGLVVGIAADALTCGTSRVKGSGIGGIESTQAVIDLCAANNIRPEISIVKPQDINSVYEKLEGQNESGLRYVVDLSSLKDGSCFEACKNVPPPKLGKPSTGLSVLMIIGGIFKMVCCCGSRRSMC